MQRLALHIFPITFPKRIFAAAAALALVPAYAYAGPAAVICSVANYASSSLGVGVASIAVVSIGIAACFGRASWTQALLVAIGCGIMGQSNNIAWAIGYGC